MNNKDFAAIILAAGSGTRMGAKVNKVYMEVAEKPLLYYSLKAFADAGVGEIVVVSRADERQMALKVAETIGFDSEVISIIDGGTTRAESSYKGICSTTKPYVLIHDAARAFVTADIIERCMKGAIEYDACIAAMPVKDTIKVAEKWSLGDGVSSSFFGEQNQPVNGIKNELLTPSPRDHFSKIASTPDRSTLWQAQTPQAFSAELIKRAYKNALDIGVFDDLTDDAGAVEILGEPVYLVNGSYTNIKVTEESDLILAQVLSSHSEGGGRRSEGAQ